MTSKYICIHGHFYQPPRENPWLETVEIQDSAAPHHDWNARITAECYRPNTASRIFDSRRRFGREPEGMWLPETAVDTPTLEALAACLRFLQSEPGVRLTVYGEYLEKHPPVREAEIVENSSWSCAHGVERCHCEPQFIGAKQSLLRNRLRLLRLPHFVRKPCNDFSAVY